MGGVRDRACVLARARAWRCGCAYVRTAVHSKTLDEASGCRMLPRSLGKHLAGAGREAFLLDLALRTHEDGTAAALLQDEPRLLGRAVLVCLYGPQLVCPETPSPGSRFNSHTYWLEALWVGSDQGRVQDLAEVRAPEARAVSHQGLA